MMRSFAWLYPEIAAHEIMVLDVTAAEGLPSGEYGYCEHYCEEPGCDCRLVLFMVHRRDSMQDWAAINYGWESAAFYSRWARCSLVEARGMRRPSLDECHSQSPYASTLLDFLAMHLRDPAQRRRVAQHYRLFKTKLRQLAHHGLLPEDW